MTRRVASGPRITSINFIRLSAVLAVTALSCIVAAGIPLSTRYVSFQSDSAPVTLEPGKPVERELAGGQKHAYDVGLTAGQYVKVTVDQRGIDVVLRLLGPDGSPVSDVDGEAASHGTEIIEYVSDAPTTYRFVVEPRVPKASAAKYEVRIAELRIATQQDISLQEARNSLAEAVRLLRAGKYSAGIPLAERALETRERLLGAMHRDVAVALNNLGELYRLSGNNVKAEDLQQRAFEIRSKVLGPEHPAVAGSLNNLASVADQKGEFEKAEQLYQRALEIREKLSEPRHPMIATLLQNLGGLYVRRGRLEKARPLYERALEIRQEVLGPQHADVATTINSLAILHRRMGDLDKAQLLAERALSIREKALPAEHPDIGQSINSVATIQLERGEFDKAEELFQRSLRIREKALGARHADVASTLNNLAIVYRNKGNFDRAEQLYRRALDIWEKTLGPDHPDLAEALNNLANVRRTRGDFEGAEQLYQRALKIRENALGRDHPSVGQSLNNLAILYKNLGDLEKAEELYQRALKIKERALNADHPDVALTLNNLGEIYRLKGDYTRAEHMHQRALEIRIKALGPEHAIVASSLNNLGIVYDLTGNTDKAEGLYKRALAISEKTMGSEHPDVVQALNNLGIIYRGRGEFDKAEEAHLRGLHIREKAFGAEHPDVANSLNLLSLVYAAKGELAKAVAAQSRANAISERHIVLNIGSGSERQKLVYLSSLSDTTDRTLSLASGVKDPEAQRSAATIVLQRKGRVLDAMSDSLTILRQRFTEQDRKLLEDLNDVTTQEATLVLNGPQRTKLAEHEKRINSLEERREKLESEISRRSAGYYRTSEPVTLAQVQAAIPPDAALVEFAIYHPFDPKAAGSQPVSGDARYIAYVLRNGGPVGWKELGPAASIDKKVAELREALRNPRRKDVRQLARVLEQEVIEPVRILLGDAKRLLLSPDGELNLIPFEALMDGQGRYLIERYSITYLGSGRDLLRMQVARDSKANSIVVANPAFGEPPLLAGARASTPSSSLRDSDRARKTVNSSADLSQIYFAPLAGTSQEAQIVKTLFADAEVLTGADATESFLKRVTAPRLLHIATHGFFLTDNSDSRSTNMQEGTRGISATAKIENPLLRSGLALAGANLRKSDGDDGILTAMEASGLNLWGTRLVTLSACDTGLGEVKNGEGVYGLRRAFVLAGTETLVMSLWPVSDQMTREMMTGYYKRLKQGEGRGEALRQVQLSMLMRKDRQHPFYWASFIQSGEWGNLDGKRSVVVPQ